MSPTKLAETVICEPVSVLTAGTFTSAYRNAAIAANATDPVCLQVSPGLVDNGAAILERFGAVLHMWADVDLGLGKYGWRVWVGTGKNGGWLACAENEGC